MVSLRPPLRAHMENKAVQRLSPELVLFEVLFCNQWQYSAKQANGENSHTLISPEDDNEKKLEA